MKPNKKEAVLVLKVVSYSRAKTKEDFIRILNESKWDPRIEMWLDTRRNGPVGTLNEYYREFGIRRYVVKGKDYELEVYRKDSSWEIIGEVNNMNEEELREKAKEDLTEYGKMLYDEGLPASRIPDLIKGIDTIHTAICRLDYANLKIWVSKSIEERMEDWAPTSASRSIRKTLEAGNII